jgi:hypothetical protein
MTTTIDAFPDYRKIDTPWEPQPIARRYHDDVHTPEFGVNGYHDPRTEGVKHLLAQVADPALTHLVREVEVTTRNGISAFELTPEETWHDLRLVDEQFMQLEALTELRVASTEWHVFKDERGLTRTLARVAIIEGSDPIIPDIESIDELNTTLLSPEEYELAYTFLTGMDRYFQNTIGEPLADINRLSQFKLGAPRSLTGTMASEALYLVDIEPGFDTSRPRDDEE